MRRKKDKSNGITALYERLSRDDDNAGESNSIVHKEIIQPNIEKEQQTPKIQYFRGFLYILKIYQTPSKHTKMFR